MSSLLLLIGLTLAIGVPLILQRSRLPRSAGFRLVSDEALTPEQRAFIEGQDADFAKLGFVPSFTVTGDRLEGANMLRVYPHVSQPYALASAVVAARGPVPPARAGSPTPPSTSLCGSRADSPTCAARGGFES